jgi:hypothetical protein
MMDSSRIESHEFIPLVEASREIGMEYQTLYRWVTSGRVPSAKFGDRWFIERPTLERLKLERAGHGQP